MGAPDGGRVGLPCIHACSTRAHTCAYRSLDRVARVHERARHAIRRKMHLSPAMRNVCTRALDAGAVRTHFGMGFIYYSTGQAGVNVGGDGAVMWSPPPLTPQTNQKVFALLRLMTVFDRSLARALSSTSSYGLCNIYVHVKCLFTCKHMHACLHACNTHSTFPSHPYRDRER